MINMMLRVAASAAWLFWIPGYAVSRVLTDDSRPVAGFGFLIGPSIFIYLAFVLGMLGAPPWCQPAIPAACLAVSFLLRRPSPAVPKLDATATAVTLLGFLAMATAFLSYETVWAATSNGYQYTAYPDHLEHLSLIQELQRGFPMQTNPLLSGMPPPPYHYFPDACLAAWASLSRTDAWIIYFHFAPLLIALMLACGFNAFFLTSSRPAVLAASVSCAQFILPVWLAHQRVWTIPARIFDFLMCNKPGLFGLVPALGCLVSLDSLMRRPSDWKIRMLAGFMLGSFFWWKAPYFFVFGAATTGTILLVRGKSSRRGLGQVLAIGVLFALPLVLYIHHLGLKSALQWRYAGLMRQFVEIPYRNVYWIQRFVRWFKDPGLFFLTAALLINATALGNLVWLFINKLRKLGRWREWPCAWVVAFFAASFVIMLGVGPRYGMASDISEQMFGLLQFIGLLFGVAWAYDFFPVQSRRAAGVGLALLGIFLVAPHEHFPFSLLGRTPASLDELAPAPDMPALATRQDPDPFLSCRVYGKEEREAFSYLKSHAPETITLFHPYCRTSHYSLVSALTGRRVALEYAWLWNGRQGFYPGAGQRRAAVARLYQTSDAVQAQSIVKSVPNPMILETTEHPLHFATAGWLMMSYTSPHVRIYALAPSAIGTPVSPKE